MDTVCCTKVGGGQAVSRSGLVPSGGCALVSCLLGSFGIWAPNAVSSPVRWSLSERSVAVLHSYSRQRARRDLGIWVAGPLHLQPTFRPRGDHERAGEGVPRGGRERERESWCFFWCLGAWQVSDDLIAVHSTFQVNDRFSLDPQDATYVLSIETPVPIFTVAVQVRPPSPSLARSLATKSVSRARSTFNATTVARLLILQESRFSPIGLLCFYVFVRYSLLYAWATISRLFRLSQRDVSLWTTPHVFSTWYTGATGSLLQW